MTLLTFLWNLSAGLSKKWPPRKEAAIPPTINNEITHRFDTTVAQPVPAPGPLTRIRRALKKIRCPFNPTKSDPL